MSDGEAAHGLMCQAHRTGRRDLYEAALHHAYAFADIGIDHADFTQQIAGMPKGSISLVLQRNLGMLAAMAGEPGVAGGRHAALPRLQRLLQLLTSA